MTTISKAEDMVSGWLKPVPHLPKGAQKWIAENAWVIVLIGVILSAIGLFIAIGGIFTYFAVVGNIASISNYYAVSPYGSGWLISSVVSLILSAAVVVFLASAINPLKALQRKGWDRLFIVLIINALSVVLSAVLSFNVFSFIFGIIFGAIGIAISAYFIFEIRSYFGAGKPVAKHVTKK